MRKAGGDWVIVSFKYERLGLFCSLCGMIGHSDQLCDKIFELEDDTGDRQWGNFLKADQRRQVNGGANKWLREGEGGARRPVLENPNNNGTDSSIPCYQEFNVGDNMTYNSSASNGEHGVPHTNIAMVHENQLFAENRGALTTMNNYGIRAVISGPMELGAGATNFNAIQGHLLAEPHVAQIEDAEPREKGKEDAHYWTCMCMEVRPLVASWVLTIITVTCRIF